MALGTELPHASVMRRRAMWSSYLGSAIEYYDFLLYGIAATLVFPKVFFALDSKAATLASFATLAVGYVARPLGAIFFGHFGDRIGRKKMLMFTLFMMGIASFAMGLLPSAVRLDESLIYRALGKRADCGGCMPLFLDTMRGCDNLAVPPILRGLKANRTEVSHEGRRESHRVSQRSSAV